jgi:putative isomerase
MKLNTLLISTIISLIVLSCSNNDCVENIYNYSNLIDYSGTPENTYDRTPFSFSDQGAWFSYGFTDSSSQMIGFTGPFSMTQENGAWISECLSNLSFRNKTEYNTIDWKSTDLKRNSYLSHLEQVISTTNIEVHQYLVFETSHKAIIKTSIKNLSDKTLELIPQVSGNIINEFIRVSKEEDVIYLTSEKSSTHGKLYISQDIDKLAYNDSSYNVTLHEIFIEPNETKSIYISHIFANNRVIEITEPMNDKKFKEILHTRINKKNTQLNKVIEEVPDKWQNQEYKNVIVKSILTLQNNWRTEKEGIPFAGCFPSYHYKWFHGFWAWDSWKHSVALVKFNSELAKDQIRAMYYFQKPNGFIPDCVYRDTSIEANNYRNTKAPLSAWSVWKVFEETKDTAFVKEMYPLITQYHSWWYKDRDHDKDSICEYGSTDGTLIAAKWESGMDNAVRFDESKILQNSEHAFSLNQESVDLNAYLYAEKLFLRNMANILGLKNAEDVYLKESQILKEKILSQFWDKESGWFYDTDITGQTFIKAMGPEGWIPLWANLATKEQAKKLIESIMDSSKFLTKVPFPTISADHPKFKPDGGYWRGPVWLDQAYFAVIALRNYDYKCEADLATKMLIENAEGLTKSGSAIRENYHPITGEGLESYNFSWSAAHYMLLLLEE